MENLNQMKSRALSKLEKAIHRYNKKEEEVIEAYEKGFPLEINGDLCKLDNGQMNAYLMLVLQRKNDITNALLNACMDLLNVVNQCNLSEKEKQSVEEVCRGLYVCSDLGSNDYEE